MHGSAGSQQALRHGAVNVSKYHSSCFAVTRGPPSVRRAPSLGSCTGAPSLLRTRVASAKQRSRTHVAVQQRPGALGDVPQQGEPHSHLAAVSRSTDDSLKIIMLLVLSLTLMLLPWMSRHPEFLIAPLLLAVTPVVGNGVRPVLKEAGASLLTALRLSFGALTHLEQQQQLPGGHHHHHHHHHHDSRNHHPHSHSMRHHNQHQQQHNTARSHMQHQQQQQQPIPQGPYSRIPQQQQHQHPAPAGPYSPWPNPAQMPAAWPLAHAAAATTTVSSGADDTDSDWAPRAPRDPHHSDPHSQQHLQQVLAADDQVEQELEQGLAAAATAAAAVNGASIGSIGSMSRSPHGSPSSSMDAGHAADHTGGDYRSHLQHHPHHVRDPRVLSKEAKQQLYHPHHHQQQQQQNGGSNSSRAV